MAKRGTTAAVYDEQIGVRVRERRVSMGLTQQQMADLIGVTYQQAHKYERGINRISAGRLFEIATVLRVPVSFFYEGLTLAPGTHKPEEEVPRHRMSLELARNFSEIPNVKHQEAVSQLVRTLAKS